MHVYSGPAVFYQTWPQNFFAVVGNVPQQAGNLVKIKILFTRTSKAPILFWKKLKEIVLAHPRETDHQTRKKIKMP